MQSLPLKTTRRFPLFACQSPFSLSRPSVSSSRLVYSCHPLYITLHLPLSAHALFSLCLPAISVHHQARTVRRISPLNRWPCAARRPTCSSCVRPTAMRYSIALWPPFAFSVFRRYQICLVLPRVGRLLYIVHVSCTCSSVNPSSRVYQNCVGRVSSEEHTKISGIFSLTSCGTLFHR